MMISKCALDSVFAAMIHCFVLVIAAFVWSRFNCCECPSKCGHLLIRLQLKCMGECLLYNFGRISSFLFFFLTPILVKNFSLVVEILGLFLSSIGHSWDFVNERGNYLLPFVEGSKCSGRAGGRLERTLWSLDRWSSWSGFRATSRWWGWSRKYFLEMLLF